MLVHLLLLWILPIEFGSFALINHLALPQRLHVSIKIMKVQEENFQWKGKIIDSIFV